MLCEEMTPRQGCFPGFVAVVELALSNHADIIGANGLRAPLYLEKYEGYAEEILKSFHFGPHDAFIVIFDEWHPPGHRGNGSGRPAPRDARHRHRFPPALRALAARAFLGKEAGGCGQHHH